MKLIDITNSHSQLVNEQLANTDAFYIKVYSLGQTTVFYADAATHRDIVILNKKRRIKDVEIEFIIHRLFHMEPNGLDIYMQITLLKLVSLWRKNGPLLINGIY